MSEGQDNPEIPAVCAWAGAREAYLAELEREEEKQLRPLVDRLEEAGQGDDTQEVLDAIVAIQQEFARKREAVERSL